MSITDSYLSAGYAPTPNFQTVIARRGIVENPYRAGVSPLVAHLFLGYRAASNPVAAQLTPGTIRTTMRRTYPTYIYVLSVVVLIGTILSFLAGYMIPGPIFGLMLPVFLSLWWLLYRTIRRYDDRKIA